MAHSFVSVIMTVISPTSSKFHSIRRFCKLYAGRLEGKQLMNDVWHRVDNESI